VCVRARARLRHGSLWRYCFGIVTWSIGSSPRRLGLPPAAWTICNGANFERNSRLLPVSLPLGLQATGPGHSVAGIELNGGRPRSITRSIS